MIFTSLWSKLTALMGLIITGLLFVVKYRGNKIDQLNDDIETIKVKEVILIKQTRFKKQALVDERNRIKAKVKKKSKQSKRDHINNL